MEKNDVESIYNSVGTEVFSHEQIEAAHVDFYTNLFSAEPIEPMCQQSLLNEISKFLSDEECWGTACPGHPIHKHPWG